MTESILGKAGSKNGKSDHASPPAQPPKCPECTSQRVWKDGIRYTRHGDVQRYLCRSCGFRFSDTTHFKVKVNVTEQSLVLPKTIQDFGNLNVVNGSPPHKGLKNSPFTLSEDIRSHAFTSVEKRINSLLHNSRERQVCVNEEKMKNLVKVASRTEKRAAGATKPSEAEIKGKIIDAMWRLKKDGYSPSTIYSYSKYLRLLAKYGANLSDPESVKDVIATQEIWSTSSKLLAVAAYSFFASHNGIRWNPPKYKPKRRLPFIPLESEIDALIASAGKKLATTLQLVKETGMRIGEACHLRWIDADMERKTITVNDPEKGSNPRILKISNKLAAMLNALPKTSEKVFGKQKPTSIANHLRWLRRRIAKKLQNPRLNQIHFHTLRHWKATMEYHKTRDLVHVMQMLGHRDVQSTLIYTHLIKFEGDEYHSAVAKTIDEAKSLIDAGFEYVCTHEDKMLFRKRR